MSHGEKRNKSDTFSDNPPSNHSGFVLKSICRTSSLIGLAMSFAPIHVERDTLTLLFLFAHSELGRCLDLCSDLALSWSTT
jgi:hypothetical protein